MDKCTTFALFRAIIMDITCTKFDHYKNPQGKLCQSSWDELVRLIETAPTYANKLDQPAVVFGSMKNDSRATGSKLLSIGGVALDIDSGLITPQEGAALLNDAGVKSIIYSTFSSDGFHPKFRVFLPLSRSYKAIYHKSLTHTADSILGFVSAPESFRQAQLMFYGRNPDTEYTVLTSDGVPLDEVPELLHLAQTHYQTEQAEAQKVSAKPRKLNLINGQLSVIDAFNESTDIHTILTQYGYKHRAGRFIAPTSSSGIAGVNILSGDSGKERAYSHHDSDPIANGFANDQFDIFSILEHDGNVNAALQAAGDFLCTPDGETITSFNRNVWIMHRIKQVLPSIPATDHGTVKKVARALAQVAGGYTLWVDWCGAWSTIGNMWEQAEARPIKPAAILMMAREHEQGVL